MFFFLRKEGREESKPKQREAGRELERVMQTPINSVKRYNSCANLALFGGGVHVCAQRVEWFDQTRAQSVRLEHAHTGM